MPEAEVVVQEIETPGRNLSNQVKPEASVIEVLNIRICLLENGPGVDYIINTGKELIFVRNRPLVHGRIFLLPNPTKNETVTNSAK